MSKSASIVAASTNNHATSAADLNRVATDFIADGVVGALANTAGAAPMTGGFAVNATGSPSNQTVVSAGIAYITATPTGSTSQKPAFQDDTGTTITHAANSSGLTKFDWIYVSPSATALATPAADASDTFTYVVSRSSSSTVDNGTPPTYGHNIAVVSLANNFVTVTNANITDRRFRAGVTATRGDLDLTQSASAADAIIKAAGPDTNIGITLTPKGTGTVKLPLALTGLVRQRQGGTTGDASWYSGGTSNTDVSGKTVFMQAGTSATSAGGDVTVTFPTPYTQIPIVIAAIASASGSNGSVQVTLVTTTNFQYRAHRNTDNALIGGEVASWLSIGQ